MILAKSSQFLQVQKIKTMTIKGSLKSQSFEQLDLAQWQGMREEVLGSRVQVLLEVTFLLNLFLSNTILVDLTE